MGRRKQCILDEATRRLDAKALRTGRQHASSSDSPWSAILASGGRAWRRLSGESRAANVSISEVREFNDRVTISGHANCRHDRITSLRLSAYKFPARHLARCIPSLPLLSLDAPLIAMKVSAILALVAATAVVAADTNAFRFARGLAPNPPAKRATPVEGESCRHPSHPVAHPVQPLAVT